MPEPEDPFEEDYSGQPDSFGSSGNEEEDKNQNNNLNDLQNAKDLKDKFSGSKEAGEAGGGAGEGGTGVAAGSEGTAAAMEGGAGFASEGAMSVGAGGATSGTAAAAGGVGATGAAGAVGATSGTAAVAATGAAAAGTTGTAVVGTTTAAGAAAASAPFWMPVVGIGCAIIAFFIFILIIIGVIIASLGGGVDTAEATPPTPGLCSAVTSSFNNPDTISTVNANIPIYKAAVASMTFPIPWEVLAAVHYEENASSRVTPVNNTADGVYQIVGAAYPYSAGHVLTDDEFLQESKAAAVFIQSKAENFEPYRKLTTNMDPLNSQDQESIKSAFWSYNGRASYQTDWAVTHIGPGTPGYEGSAYVMTGWDDLRATMEVRIFDTSGNLIDTVLKDSDGAWKVFVLLKKATYDSGGLITEISDSCSTDAPSDTAIPFGCPVLNGTAAGYLFNEWAQGTNGWYYHQGIDISGTDFGEVKATMSGTLVEVGENGGYGYNVVVQGTATDGTIYKTRYGHMARGEFLVVDGQTVNRGQVIGHQHNTGLSISSGGGNGSHVHYEVMKNGIITDPTPFIPMPNEHGATCSY